MCTKFVHFLCFLTIFCIKFKNGHFGLGQRLVFKVFKNPEHRGPGGIQGSQIS